MKTLAIRLEEDRHAQLSVLAQLAGRTITDEIREAIERHIEARKADPELTMKAEGVLEESQAAIATLFGVKNTNHPNKPTNSAPRPNGRKKPSARIKVGFV